ncbi:hypothetical protein J5U21_01776 [Saccharolobus shibatae]|uniref:Uncharacterized protein n=1 Tax=Saccharolobus shibatae TaxID=2286 RepID=A0A8F5BVG7_9CREN|nr:hypothetical protein J5U21_01776 [Saccharolobus shibatae]
MVASPSNELKKIIYYRIERKEQEVEGHKVEGR